VNRSAGPGATVSLLRCLASVCLLIAAVDAAAAPTQSRAELVRMARAGAPGLALRLMDEAQPAAAERPQQWIAWERARIGVLADARAWRRALDRLGQRPSHLPADFDRWAKHREARFHLQLGEASAARQRLRELLWRRSDGVGADTIRVWRRDIVETYVVGGAVDDAVTAMRRFDQDYRDTGPEWAGLRARVLLRAGRADEAARHLTQHASSSPAAQALTLLARLRSDGGDGATIAAEARRAARAEDAAPADRARFWFVAAEAGQTPADVALASERAAAAARHLSPEDELFRMGGDALWQAWLALGRWYANEHELLIGDDQAWFDAVEAAQPQYPVRARALLAMLARKGDPAARRRAHAALVERIGDSDPGMRLAHRAYLDTSIYPEISDIPARVRHALVDDALARDDVALATRLFADLDEPPEGVEAFEWGTVRARVLILGGRADEGVAALQALLDDYPRLQGDRLDRLLQVIFDLQGGGYHEATLELLQRLARREPPGQRKRELLFWQAESHEAREDYARAGELYMRSALLVEGSEGDQWGQTARYHAGRMLAEAGLVSDARRIFRQLLSVTDSEERRTTLRRRLHKLGLREAGPFDVPAAPTADAR